MKREFMDKRTLLKRIGLFGLLFMMVCFFYDRIGISILIRKLKGRFKKTPANFPEKRGTQVLPYEGGRVSVEKAMNSRCCSDYDGDPEIFHWGMFDRNNSISFDQMNKVTKCAHVPLFKKEQPSIKIEQNKLHFIIEPFNSKLENEHANIESGIQQQAISLVCAAFGVGMVFRNQGKNGKKLSTNEFLTIKMKLDAMKPSYNGSYWSDSEPKGENAWRSGNLPDPVRNGNTPLLEALAKIKSHNLTGGKASVADIGQLLWAARGRTPHFYKSIPWGLTIPTWGGEQKLSGIYLICKDKIFKYSNTKGRRPTHSLERMIHQKSDVLEEISSTFPGNNCHILLVANEENNRVLWEIGYQILNMLVQIVPLNIAFKLFFFNETQRHIFNRLEIGKPVATIALKTKDNFKLS